MLFTSVFRRLFSALNCTEIIPTSPAGRFHRLPTCSLERGRPAGEGFKPITVTPFTDSAVSSKILTTFVLERSYVRTENFSGLYENKNKGFLGLTNIDTNLSL